jgi:hypothetical protein
MKKIFTLLWAALLIAGAAQAQYLEWEDLFRVYRSPAAGKENAVLDLGFDFDRTYTNANTKQLCYHFKRVMMGNEGEWDEFISFCKEGSVLTYKTENSTQYQRLRGELVDKYNYAESDQAGTADGGLKATYVNGNAKIQFYSNRDKAGKANNIIAVLALPASSLAAKSPATNGPPNGRNRAAPAGKDQALGVDVGPAQARFHALVIGVQQYADPSLNLNYPVRDARALAAVLTQHYTFDPKNVTVLTNPQKDEIYRAFEKFNSLNKDDNLLIFYAGHGKWDEQRRQGYWLPSDARPDSRVAWISNSDLKDFVRCIPTRHTLLISDACFSGGIFKTRNPGLASASQAVRVMYASKSRRAMTSGALNEVPDHSVFVEYLVQRLTENKEKYLSAESMFRSMQEAVTNNSPNEQIPQFGVIGEAGDEGGNFIFIKR